MNPRRVRLLVAVFACVLFVPLASANVYDFTQCPSSNPGCVANASLGSSTVTYTNGGISITANGYHALPSPTEFLYFKVGSISETGLGLANEGEFEIGPGNFIQLDLTNLAAAGITSGTLSIGSVQAEDGFRICNSASLGVMGVCGANVIGGDVDSVIVNWSKANPIIGVTAATGLTSTDNVLLVKQFVTANPPFAGCTVTQGGWGAPPHGNNPAAFLKSKFSTVYPAGVTIGGTETLLFTSSSAIGAFLPQGGPPSFLNVSLVNPTSNTSAGVFAGQVLALQLNVDLFGFGSLVLTGTGTSLDGKTVADVLAAANIALGGGALPTGFASFSSLNDLVDSLNGSFDGCVPDAFATNHLTSPI